MLKNDPIILFLFLSLYFRFSFEFLIHEGIIVFFFGLLILHDHFVKEIRNSLHPQPGGRCGVTHYFQCFIAMNSDNNNSSSTPAITSSTPSWDNSCTKKQSIHPATSCPHACYYYHMPHTAKIPKIRPNANHLLLDLRKCTVLCYIFFSPFSSQKVRFSLVVVSDQQNSSHHKELFSLYWRIQAKWTRHLLEISTIPTFSEQGRAETNSWEPLN